MIDLSWILHASFLHMIFGRNLSKKVGVEVRMSDTWSIYSLLFSTQGEHNKDFEK